MSSKMQFTITNLFQLHAIYDGLKGHPDIHESVHENIVEGLKSIEFKLDLLQYETPYVKIEGVFKLLNQTGLRFKEVDSHKTHVFYPQDNVLTEPVFDNNVDLDVNTEFDPEILKICEYDNIKLIKDDGFEPWANDEIEQRKEIMIYASGPSFYETHKGNQQYHRRIAMIQGDECRKCLVDIFMPDAITYRTFLLD